MMERILSLSICLFLFFSLSLLGKTPSNCWNIFVWFTMRWHAKWFRLWAVFFFFSLWFGFVYEENWSMYLDCLGLMPSISFIYTLSHSDFWNLSTNKLILTDSYQSEKKEFVQPKHNIMWSRRGSGDGGRTNLDPQFWGPNIWHCRDLACPSLPFPPNPGSVPGGQCIIVTIYLYVWSLFYSHFLMSIVFCSLQCKSIFAFL